MSRSRHKARAAGGKVMTYAGGDSNVMKEAHERKRGGKVEHEKGEGEAPKHRADKRARGGAAPGRKRGGGVGANLTPLSTAARIKEVTKGEMKEDSPKDD